MHGVRLRLLQVETDPPAPPQEAPDEGDEVPRVQLQRGRHLADGEALGRETRRMAHGKTISFITVRAHRKEPPCIRMVIKLFLALE